LVFFLLFCEREFFFRPFPYPPFTPFQDDFLPTAEARVSLSIHKSFSSPSRCFPPFLHVLPFFSSWRPPPLDSASPFTTLLSFPRGSKISPFFSPGVPGYSSLVNPFYHRSFPLSFLTPLQTGSCEPPPVSFWHIMTPLLLFFSVFRYSGEDRISLHPLGGLSSHPFFSLSRLPPLFVRFGQRISDGLFSPRTKSLSPPGPP